VDSRRAPSCASGVAVVAIAAHLLIGCTAVDKIAARFGDDGELEFAVCATLDINRIEVRQERASETEAVNELWVATGEHALDDERLAYGQPPAGMANEFDPVTSLPARFVFYAERDDADGSVLDAVQATSRPAS
jgi:hypothetical protein